MTIPARRLALAGTAVLATIAVSGALLPGTPAQAVGTGLNINEVYARGGSANQPYVTKFVELANPTASAISLSGYGLSYSSGTMPISATGAP